MSITEQVYTPDLSPKWQERFAFFEQYGSPKTPGFKEALRQLPAKKQRLVVMNFTAFFFGFIYFFVLGLWKKNLTMLAIIIVTRLVISFAFYAATRQLMPMPISMGINAVFGTLYSMSANYAYYLKKVKGSQGWNPFEGMRWF